jgi:zinc-ribbon domain/Sel1 repeat
VRCSRCGNENPGTNRFCGMCGATLLPAPGPVPAPQIHSVPSPAPQIPSAPAPATPAPTISASAPPSVARPVPQTPAPRTTPDDQDRPVISGPSFLGLNDPPPRKRASLSIDPERLDSRSAPSSSSLDYLLEDEEPPQRGTWKFVLIAVALALVAGLGYMRWKNQSFGWLNSGPSKPVATQPSDASDLPTPDSSSGTPANPSAIPPSGQPAADATATQPNPADKPTPVKSVPATVPAADATGSDSTPHPTVTKSTESDDPNVSPATTAKARTPVAAAPITSTSIPAPKPVKGADPVTEAQKYIYGKGVRQDCDRGLRLLKPAAERANPKAMIEMGALYSAGLCTPRDLPTAYRWFAIALRKDPDNQSVQTDLQKLWGEMTQPERQLAIRLSQ